MTEKKTHEPTPFEAFFAGPWKDNLDAVSKLDSGPVFSNGRGIATASWDRKAAWMLWMMVHGHPSPTEMLKND